MNSTISMSKKGSCGKHILYKLIYNIKILGTLDLSRCLWWQILPWQGSSALERVTVNWVVHWSQPRQYYLSSTLPTGQFFIGPLHSVYSPTVTFQMEKLEKTIIRW